MTDFHLQQMTPEPRQPWTGNLSADLRKGALSVSADGLTLIDEKGVCWGIIFPDKSGFYNHAVFIAEAVNSHKALLTALKAIAEAKMPGEARRIAVEALRAVGGSHD